MIIGKIHPGSGLGDQLFSYIITRVIALDRGFDFGFVGKEFFKGAGFMNLDWGKDALDELGMIRFAVEYPANKIVLHGHEHKVFEFNKPYYDPAVNFIQDGTIIDGTGAQDERYWGHRLEEIREWLVNPNWPVDITKEAKEDKSFCCINYRGGEYKTVPELYLSKEYWIDAMNLMVEKGPNIKFQVHTDDPEEARKVFGEKAAIMPNDTQLNWMCVRHFKNAIISNSAFAIIPRLLKHLEDPEAVTIVPFGWNARNASLTEWKGRPMNYYKNFLYI